MHACQLIARLCRSRLPAHNELPCHLAGLLLVATQERRMPRKVKPILPSQILRSKIFTYTKTLNDIHFKTYKNKDIVVDLQVRLC